MDHIVVFSMETTVHHNTIQITYFELQVCIAATTGAINHSFEKGLFVYLKLNRVYTSSD